MARPDSRRFAGGIGLRLRFEGGQFTRWLELLLRNAAGAAQAWPCALQVLKVPGMCTLRTWRAHGSAGAAASSECQVLAAGGMRGDCSPRMSLPHASCPCGTVSTVVWHSVREAPEPQGAAEAWLPHWVPAVRSAVPTSRLQRFTKPGPLARFKQLLCCVWLT